jgi:hypothetical protein
MKKGVWIAVVVVMSLGMFGAPVLAQSSDGHRQVRVERQQHRRERVDARREALGQRLGDERFRRLERHRFERMDRNRDGFLSRREIVRYRIALRRTLRRALRWSHR